MQSRHESSAAERSGEGDSIILIVIVVRGCASSMPEPARG
jgi:hypothetical protein